MRGRRGRHGQREGLGQLLLLLLLLVVFFYFFFFFFFVFFLVGVAIVFLVSFCACLVAVHVVAQPIDVLILVVVEVLVLDKIVDWIRHSGRLVMLLFIVADLVVVVVVVVTGRVRLVVVVRVVVVVVVVVIGLCVVVALIVLILSLADDIDRRRRLLHLLFLFLFLLLLLLCAALLLMLLALGALGLLARVLKPDGDDASLESQLFGERAQHVLFGIALQAKGRTQRAHLHIAELGPIRHTRS